MKHGDFTALAKNYINRPAYSNLIIDSLLKHVEYNGEKTFTVADVGAGTGKLTKVLLETGLNVKNAVEPNDQMREEGINYTKGHNIDWIAGSGEKTNLPSNSFNWLLMASSFHWTDPNLSLPEFHRVIKPGGYFTAIWNPRDISSSELHTRIENVINDFVPNMQRVSSGSNNTKKWEEVLVSTGHFKDAVFMECNHVEVMSKERYMGIWKSVNDIRVQAGEEGFVKILNAIEKEISHLDTIEVPYKMRAWTAKRV